jgi:TolB-like protein
LSEWRYSGDVRIMTSGTIQWCGLKPANCGFASRSITRPKERPDPLVIELPKGGYAPAFREQKKAPEATAISEPRPTEQRTPANGRMWLLVALACLAVALMVVGWWRFQRQSAPIPIAVLPLTNLSQDSANDYFSDGLTNEIIHDLSIIDGLAVRSQTSSFAYRGKPRNIREAGNQLGADYILEGSVLRFGHHLRINAQFVRVRDDFPVWSGRYDREFRTSLLSRTRFPAVSSTVCG